MPVPALRPWLLDTVLPFWAEAGIDPRNGGFVERLDLDRRPEPDADRRLRVQARQIYVFSHGHLLGAPEWALEAARSGFRFLTEHGWDTDGGWHHLLTGAGEPKDRRKDTYDHAFVLYAMAWLHRATGEDAPLDWAERTIGFLDHCLADPRGGGYWEELAPDGATDRLPRRQNPHMHLLEACLALFEATGDADWRRRAEGIIALFHDHFFDAETGTLGEFFTADWQPADGAEGMLREPGHHLEWVWLLLHYRRLTGDESVVGPADRLYWTALQSGLDGPPEGIAAALDAVDRTGAVVEPGKRLWPQTEAIKAHLARHELIGDMEAGDRARLHLAMMFEHYLGADDPTWRDRLSRDGRVLSDHIPASTLYHLFLCIAEVLRVLGADEAGYRDLESLPSS